ncbi:MAG: hypothetical protein ILM98_13905 [Kiritimatiellae bacterium]|nr:hypothetical protein [Kiritimatiellia bacterium]
MKKILVAMAVAALAMTGSALTVEEARAEWEAARIASTNARAQVHAARKAYDAALAEAGMTNEVGTAAARRRAKLAAKAAKAQKVAATPALTKEQTRFLENRRIAVKRDTTSIPGSVITTWYRNGKPDTLAPAVVTNRLQYVVGAEQNNPLQALAEQLREDVAEWRAAATNSAARVERVSAALDERRAEYVQKRDAAALPTTKALYQAFIDAIDRIKARIDREDDE